MCDNCATKDGEIEELKLKLQDAIMSNQIISSKSNMKLIEVVEARIVELEANITGFKETQGSSDRRIIELDDIIRRRAQRIEAQGVEIVALRESVKAKDRRIVELETYNG